MGEQRGVEMSQQRTGRVYIPWVAGDQIDGLLTRRADYAHTLIQHRNRGANSRQPLHRNQQAFVEPAWIARLQLILRLTDDPFRQLPHRTVEARAGDLRGEQQRHTDSDPQDRQELLHEHDPRLQPDPVQMSDARQPHRPARTC